MSFGLRLKAMIKEERVSQRQFSEEINFPLTTLEYNIAGRSEPSGALLIKIGSHEKYRKYAMWLLNGEVQPGTGQVCPSFSILEQCGLSESESKKRA
ncbi:helix-turn-helix transcriptional regulator [Vibrio scophthalmi]|uniref:helix-turn-helix domain-containing protein n=1 Tax=Vibrio scophthalmi TaxID=45658 RepID=UPI0038735C37